MTKGRIIGFWIAMLVFTVVALSYLYYQGVLQTLSGGGSAILVIAFGIIAVFLYKYVASHPDKFE
ncbi:MAG: hypothetical protein GXP15_04635 [Gammaproteobacteria bacterium]|nr:hypothetical protein [Gammaproteobacteria bacterium]